MQSSETESRTVPSRCFSAISVKRLGCESTVTVDVCGVIFVCSRITEATRNRSCTSTSRLSDATSSPPRMAFALLVELFVSGVLYARCLLYGQQFFFCLVFQARTRFAQRFGESEDEKSFRRACNSEQKLTRSARSGRCRGGPLGQPSESQRDDVRL
jgi:hypothetical protein